MPATRPCDATQFDRSAPHQRSTRYETCPIARSSDLAWWNLVHCPPSKNRTGPAVRSGSLLERRGFELPVLFCGSWRRKGSEFQRGHCAKAERSIILRAIGWQIQAERGSTSGGRVGTRDYQERKIKPRRTSHPTRLTLMWLSHWFNWRSVLTVVTPKTFIGWHRKGFQLYWRRNANRPAADSARAPTSDP
jgi:hypothetical protein